MKAVVFTKPTGETLVEVARQFESRPDNLMGDAEKDPKPSRIIFRNRSGEQIPAYGCFRVGGAETDATTSNYVVLAIKPDNSGGPFLFNGPRPVDDDKMGVAKSGIVKALYTGGPPAVSETWGPKNSFALEANGDAAIMLGVLDATKQIAFASTFGGTGANQFLRVTPDADLNTASTGLCTIQGGTRDGEKIYVVFDWIDDEKISAGKEIIVGRFLDEEPLPDPGNGQSEFWRPVSAQCEPPPPPNDGQIQAGSAAAIDPTWTALPGGTTAYNFGAGYTADPSNYLFTVDQPGYWRLSLAFTFEALANNTNLEIRTVSGAGPGPGVVFPIRQADNTTAATVSETYAVTQAAIDAGTIGLGIEYQTNNPGTFINSQLSITRLGYGVPT